MDYQSQKMKSTGTLAGGISRDFNNIPTYIIGYTELVPEALKNSALPDVCFYNPYLKFPAMFRQYCKP
jgi:hypothetical protein